MYVCVCKAVTDKQIRNAMENGVCTHQQLFKCFGVGGDCGKCSKQVKQMLDEDLQQHAVIQPASNAANLKNKAQITL